jgi:hypothetical protein
MYYTMFEDVGMPMCRDTERLVRRSRESIMLPSEATAMITIKTSSVDAGTEQEASSYHTQLLL